MRPSFIMARRRFFVEKIEDGEAELAGDDAAHLTRVLRVEPGQLFEISDNRNAWLAEVIEARKSSVRFSLKELLTSGPLLPPVHLCVALFKFDRLEWLIEKATELGVSWIRPVETERSDKGLFSAANKRVERWRRIAHEASQQSRRLRVPSVADPVRLADLTPEGTPIWLEEQPGTPPLAVPQVWSVEHPVSLLLGPEGGWTDGERQLLERAGWQAASLGGSVLRSETAGMAALAVLSYVWLERQHP